MNEKISNIQIKRLYESLVQHEGETFANEFINELPLNKNPNAKKRMEWAQTMCSRLEKQFNEEEVIKIRRDCCCKPSIDKLKRFKKLFEQSKTLKEYTDGVNKMEEGAALWNNEKSIFISYPECYCSFVNHNDNKLPKSWCYCTLGYSSYMYEYILGYKPEVELLESVKMGNSRCVIRIDTK